MNDERTIRTRSRVRLFRWLAVLVGLIPLFIAEIGLRIAGLGHPHQISDPFVDSSAVRPLFERSANGDRFEIPRSRQPFFKPDSFAAKKAANEFRIFCLGGSTVQGNPYSVETSFTTWLELSLRAADSSRGWEVVNCGGISYASYRLEPIFRECLGHQPDLIILYVGDNEFLEDRSFLEAAHPTPWLEKVAGVAARSHLFNYSRQLWMAISTQRRIDASRRTSLNAEVDTLLDYQGGLAQYHRDPVWRQGVTDHFRFAFSSMLARAKAANVPLLVIDPVSNVKDCPPFKVEFDGSSSTNEQQRITELLAEAALQGDSSRQIEQLEAARSLDANHAGVQYQLGQAYLAANRDEEARQILLLAKDNDVCPLRMTEPLRDIQNLVSRQFDVPIVPVFAEFSQRSPHGIPGDELLLDHVHPTISGQQLIAELLFTQMSQSGWVDPGDDWLKQRQQLYNDHLATLDAPYYARGQEHLEGLRRWAQGRVKKQRQVGKP